MIFQSTFHNPKWVSTNQAMVCQKNYPWLANYRTTSKTKKAIG